MSQFKVSGLRCSGCASRLAKEIQSADGDAVVDIDIADGDVRVRSTALDAQEVAELISGAGFGVHSVAV